MFDSIVKIFDQLNIKPLHKTGNSVVGIDIGSSFIKVVQLRKEKGRAVLETYGELALGPIAGFEVGRMTNLPEDKIIGALLDVMKEANVTSKNAAISIPIASSLISFLEMPYVSEKQLGQMINLEARKYIPVPISEVALDWWIIPDAESGGDTPMEMETGDDDVKPESDTSIEKNNIKKVNVLIAAIHNDTLVKYGNIVKATGLSSTFFEIEIFSTIRSTLGHDMSPVMVFDMGAGVTKISIVERGIIKSSHSINKGSQDITLALSHSLGVTVAKAEDLKREKGILSSESDEEGKKIAEIIKTNLEYVFSETNRLLLNYERKYKKTISKVILTGGGVILKGFLEEAKKNLESDVVLGDPFSKVEAPAFLEDLLKGAGPEFAVAIGLALRKLQEME